MKNKPTKRNTVYLRLDDSTYSQLLDLCKAYNVTTQQYLTADIQQAFDKFNGSPLLRQMLNGLNDLTSKLKEQTKVVLEQQQEQPEREQPEREPKP